MLSLKQDPSLMVAIAPTPPAQHQKSASSSDQIQEGASQMSSALEILQQPPETWYKDQFGRKATFEIQVKRTEAFCAQCVEQRILAVQLLYESGKLVEKQEILHVMVGQCLDKNRQSTLAVRIAEVSKNHLNQRFRIKISVPACPGRCDHNPSVVSDPVLVLSKKKKRAVKENAETGTSAKMKKTKRASVQGSPKRKMSDDSLENSPSTTSTPKIEESMIAEITEMGETVPPQAPDTMAPFTPATPNLCLWANAAFDFLYKLQWQRAPTRKTDKPRANLDEILAQALTKAYKCPSCQEAYGRIPTHKEDCDLKLLLEQSGQSDASAAHKVVSDTAHRPLQWSSDKHPEWPDRPKAMYSGGDITWKIPPSSCNFALNLHQLSGPANDETPSGGFDFATVAANSNVNSWKNYASLSKLLYSTSYLEARMSQAGSSFSPTLQWTGVLPPVGTLSPGFPSLPSATKKKSAVAHTFGSQRFSALLSATNDMSPDAADLFRESEASLHGDGNIVKSLDSMNLSDIIRPGEIYSSGSRLSVLLSGDQSKLDMSSENCVHIIMASDFQDCGFPALDASFNLVGFYHLVTETKDSPAELRFAPNLFPLPVEMLQDLKNTLTKWKENPSIIHKLDNKLEDSLVNLKSAVLREVTH